MNFKLYLGLAGLLMLVLFMFGFISSTTGVFQAIGISLVPVGVLALAMAKGNPAIGVSLLLAGILLAFLGASVVPELTIGRIVGGAP